MSLVSSIAIQTIITIRLVMMMVMIHGELRVRGGKGRGQHAVMWRLAACRAGGRRDAGISMSVRGFRFVFR